ncbi:MAG TPA: RNA polymerase sigma factor [Phycisphaerales bacterium]|mgnify:CR=1 FL=1|nr:RNA polymerase sigma factor [Phycisphaerales bacterium]HMP37272.1 RNA polymerase sigma factor [Phycisphaerales bacterium]
MDSTFEATKTTTALLEALIDPANDAAWRAFVARCTPIMCGVARRMNVHDGDLEDVVQSSLWTFLASWRQGQYDRARGRLSGFLITILRSRIIDQRRHRQRRVQASESLDSVSEIADDSAVAKLWMDERQLQIVLAALEELRRCGVDDRTIKAFELYALRGVPVAEVAANLGMTADDVYSAKYRVSKRLRPIAARLDELYEDV